MIAIQYLNLANDIMTKTVILHVYCLPIETNTKSLFTAKSCCLYLLSRGSQEKVCSWKCKFETVKTRHRAKPLGETLTI